MRLGVSSIQYRGHPIVRGYLPAFSYEVSLDNIYGRLQGVGNCFVDQIPDVIAGGGDGVSSAHDAVKSNTEVGTVEITAAPESA